MAIQRIPLIFITKAYRSTADVTFNILANVPTVYLKIEQENKLNHILTEIKTFNIYNETLVGGEISQKYDLWQYHPAVKVSFRYSEGTNLKADIKIFTDGSKNNDKTGSAFVVFDSTGNIIEYKQHKLPPYSNSYEAEIIAIDKALDFIQANCKHTYQILTHSLSTLKALKIQTTTSH